jgi:hypothetical protein
MSHAVLRIYDNAPNLADALLAREDDIRSLLTGVKGFQTWGMFRTDTGVVSGTICETAEACAETVVIAADFLAKNLADLHVAPPTVLSGEVIYNLSARKPEAQPYTVTTIFSDPPPPGLKERAELLRETTLARDGFRHAVAIGPTNTGGGVTILVADDKASADAIRQANREYIEKEYPEAKPTRPPRIIEGQAVARITAEGVPA